MALTFEVEYEDGTLIKGLSFAESEKRFLDALETDNTCRVRPEVKDDYKAP
jgi:hypothetical protein